MMNWGLVLASVIVGFPLSWITARRAGRFWTEAKAIGGNLQVMVIASVIMAAVGFTGTYFIVLLSLAVTLQVLDEAIVKAVFPFLVGSAGMPVVGVMPALWLNGQVARQREQYLSAGPAARVGTRAASDVVYTALNAPDIFSSIGKVFKGGGKGGGGKSGGGKGGKGGGGGGGGDLKGLAILLLLALALLALCAGVVTTILIVMQADREHVGEIYDLYKPA